MKGTKTVGKQVGELLATNRTCLYSRQLFCVGKLESDENAWPTCVGNYQPSKTSSTHVNYFRDTSQKGGREAVHNCPAVWDVSSLAYKDTNRNKENKTEERADKLDFCPNLSISPPLSISSLLFLCFTVVHVLLHLKNGHVANYRVCYLTRV